MVQDFEEPGTYTVAVEVMDGNGLTSTAEVVVEVTLTEGIPEFSTLLIPIVAVVVLFFGLLRLRGRRG